MAGGARETLDMEETLSSIYLLKSGKGSIYYNALQLGATTNKQATLATMQGNSYRVDTNSRAS